METLSWPHVTGLDVGRDAQIQGLIMAEGLLTGRRVERRSASEARSGLELKPQIVVSVRFEGVTREAASGHLRLRDPVIVAIRSDKTAQEADTAQTIEELYIKQRIG